MYFMGMFEFRQYMNAAEKLREIQEEQELIIHNAYVDIHPTRVHFDYEQGKMYSESLNVADYAIWLIEMKESHSKHREFWKQRATAFEKVLNSLSEEEQKFFGEVKSNAPGVGRPHRMVIEKLKKELEKVVAIRLRRESAIKESFANVPDIEEWDKKVEAMSEAELLEGYWDCTEVAL